MANNKFNKMKIFNNKTNSFVNQQILESINKQKKTPNPLIKKVDSITYDSVSGLIKSKIIKKDEKDSIERKRNAVIIPETPIEEFIEKHNSEMNQLKSIADKEKINSEISNGEFKKVSLDPLDVSYLLSGDEKSLPKGKPNEPIYTFKPISKPFIERTLVHNKINKTKININKKISDFKNKIIKKINKAKLNLYHYIFNVLNKFSKFLYLQTLSKEQRDSLKNMEFNPNSSDNSAIVKLILQKHFNVKELKDKVKKFEQIDNDRNNRLLFE